MKYIICFILLLGIGDLFAQNLQFNQVKSVGTVSQTVPQGKVWKIESILYSVPVGAVQSSLTQNDQIVIDGTTITVRSARSGNGSYNGASYFVWEQHLPIWLNEGSSLQASTNVFKISIVEFNIVP